MLSVAVDVQLYDSPALRQLRRHPAVLDAGAVLDCKQSEKQIGGDAEPNERDGRQGYSDIDHHRCAMMDLLGHRRPDRSRIALYCQTKFGGRLVRGRRPYAAMALLWWSSVMCRSANAA